MRQIHTYNRLAIHIKFTFKLKFPLLFTLKSYVVLNVRQQTPAAQNLGPWRWRSEKALVIQIQCPWRHSHLPTAILVPPVRVWIVLCSFARRSSLWWWTLSRKNVKSIHWFLSVPSIFQIPPATTSDNLLRIDSNSSRHFQIRKI